MKSNRSIPAVTTVPVLTVADVRAAVAWLTQAFGFTERLRIGEGHRSQLEVPDGGAVILAEVRPDTRVPTRGTASHSVLVRVSDARAHFVRSRDAGARILLEPTDFEYGERQYAAEDPSGHRWTFSETLADVDPAQWLEP
ncbi:MAG: VOC family protein [Solirubrobacteraceae bacterium]